MKLSYGKALLKTAVCIPYAYDADETCVAISKLSFIQ